MLAINETSIVFFFPVYVDESDGLRLSSDPPDGWYRHDRKIDPSFFSYIRDLFRSRSGDKRPVGKRPFNLRFDINSARFDDLIGGKGVFFFTPSSSALSRLGLADGEQISFFFRSIDVQFFSSGIAIISIDVDFSNENVAALSGLYAEIILEFLAEVTNISESKKPRLNFSKIGSTSLRTIFSALVEALALEGRSLSDYVRVPSLCLLSSQHGDSQSLDEIVSFSCKVARRHNGDYRTLVDNDQVFFTFENIIFSISFEGAAMFVSNHAGDRQFFRNFRSDKWVRSYLPIYLLVLHEFFYMQYLQLEACGLPFGGVDENRDQIRVLLGRMSEFVTRMRFGVISQIQQHNIFFSKARSVLLNDQTYMQLESDLKSLHEIYQTAIVENSKRVLDSIQTRGFWVAVAALTISFISLANDLNIKDVILKCCYDLFLSALGAI